MYLSLLPPPRHLVVVRRPVGLFGIFGWIALLMVVIPLYLAVAFWVVFVPWVWRNAPGWWAQFQAWRARRAGDRSFRPVVANELVRIIWWSTGEVLPARVTHVGDDGYVTLQTSLGVCTRLAAELLDPVDDMPTTGEPCRLCGRRSGAARSNGSYYQPRPACPRHQHMPPPQGPATGPVGPSGQSRARG